MNVLQNWERSYIRARMRSLSSATRISWPFFVHFSHFSRIAANFPGPYQASILRSSSLSDTSFLRGTHTSRWKWLDITANV